MMFRRWMLVMLRGLPVAVLALVILAAVASPLITPHDPFRFDIAHRLSNPSSTHWLGTDQFGRDVLSRLIYGARASMEVAFGSTILAAMLGVALGLLGGYFSGIVELITVRVADIILSFPPIVLAILVVTVFGPGVVTLTFVIAILYVPTFARLTYGEVLSVTRMEYVEASRALGASHTRTMVQTVLPNVLAPAIVQFSLAVAGAVLLETGLSFLGLGVVPPTPSWGGMIRDAQEYILENPLSVVWPCLAIILVVMSTNLLGDSLRDALDPKLRNRTKLATGLRLRIPESQGPTKGNELSASS